MRDKEFYPGRVVRHRGERKVIKQVSYSADLSLWKIVFVDNSVCTNLKEIELDGRK